MKRFWYINVFITKNSDGSNTILLNIKLTRTSFFEHQTNLKVFIYWWSNSNTLFLASNDRTSNFEPKRAITRFTKLLLELTRTSNELERIGNRTRTPYFWLRTIEHQISNIVWPITTKESFPSVKINVHVEKFIRNFDHLREILLKSI